MIPAAKKSDHEDVAWALSTAESQWAQGERGEAIKWLRRAAEAASEVEDDSRALELAKAVAEITASAPPAAPSSPPKPVEIPRPPPTPKPTSVSPPRPATGAPPRPPSVAPKAPAAPMSRPAPSAPRAAALTQTRPSSAPKAPQPKRAGRKSIPPKDDDRTDTDVAKKLESAATDKDATPPPPSAKDPRSQMPTTPPAAAAVAATDADAWPTETMAGSDLQGFENVGDTRVGAPPPLAPHPHDRLAASQAVRVIVWRDANGVHVAPAGTTVTAITVDAMLVAMDTSADLSAWLSRK